MSDLPPIEMSQSSRRTFLEADHGDERGGDDHGSMRER